MTGGNFDRNYLGYQGCWIKVRSSSVRAPEPEKLAKTKWSLTYGTPCIRYYLELQPLNISERIDSSLVEGWGSYYYRRYFDYSVKMTKRHKWLQSTIVYVCTTVSHCSCFVLFNNNVSSIKVCLYIQDQDGWRSIYCLHLHIYILSHTCINLCLFLPQILRSKS